MSADKNKNLDYEPLGISAKNGVAKNGDQATLKPFQTSNRKDFSKNKLNNPNKKAEAVKSEAISKDKEILQTEFFPILADHIKPETETSYAEQQKSKKKKKKIEKDQKLLSNDRWINRNGHSLTYIGIFLFTFVLYFRPYELIPGLSGLSSIAFILAIATLLIYLPTQISSEGSLTILSTEVKCVLFITFWALLTMPLAKSPGTVWETFNDTFNKVIVMFIVMVNTLRTPARLKGLMWLSIGVGVMLSFQAVELYRAGEFAAEGYRVSVEYGGMFGNPNDLAMHLVIVTPMAFAFGMAAKKMSARILYFGLTFLLIIGNMVTQSRGAFLALIAVATVLVWKLGKKQRFKVVLISLVVGILFIAVAPGDYGKRILSIFIPSLDPVGSSDQRKELLELSLIVTLRNPWGIGLGNFPIVGVRNLQTHNAYTQVSSELGWLAFACYLILIVSPLRKLGAIERQLFANEETNWLYYMAIGVQGSIVAYMVASFFGAVAYNWFLYYPIAYAICLRRIYRASQIEKGIEVEGEKRLSNYFKLQKT